ncbi:MAG: hypothetical protein IJ838_06620 [Paludibacteraceae bacterium]|nr:hypothetical protein [Paludibacteraceae bacterium]
MPYRRLPNTDQMRLKALQTAIQRASEADFNEQVLAYHTQSQARNFLLRFESAVSRYHDNFRTRVSSNKDYRHIVQNARMYISHFIQVLNLTIIRGEIKKQCKELYHLDPNSHILPDLSSEEDILVWGKNIIEGEEQRIAQGGYPLQNPSIQKVKVYYDIFRDKQVDQDFHKKTESRITEDLTGLREEADRIILDIWNQVDSYYKNLLPYAHMRACQSYGLIYYYRPHEKRLSETTDRLLQQKKEAQPAIQWFDQE